MVCDQMALCNLHVRDDPLPSRSSYLLMLRGLYRYIREWITEFELAAKETWEGSTTGTPIGHTGGSAVEAAYPLGLSRCGVCGAVLVRMKLHSRRTSVSCTKVCVLVGRLIIRAWVARRRRRLQCADICLVSATHEL